MVALREQLAQARTCLGEVPPAAGEALVLLQKASFQDPENSDVYALRGEAYKLLCDFCSAALNLQRGAACGGEGGKARASRAISVTLSGMLDAQGIALLSAGQNEAAEGMFAAACRADRNSVPPLFHRAIAQTRLQHYHEALASLESAIGLSPHDPRFYLLRARVHWQTKNYSHASQDVVDGLEIGRLPELVAISEDLRRQSDASYAQGTEHMIAKEWPQALSCLKFACSTDPRSGLKHLRKGIAQRFCDGAEAAVKDLTEALGLLTADRSNAEGAAGAQSNTELIASAKAQLAICLNEIGMKHFEDGQHEQAEDYFTRTLALKRVGAYLINRGDALLEQGKTDMCITDYMEALDEYGEGADIPLEIRVYLRFCLYFQYARNCMHQGTCR